MGVVSCGDDVQPVELFDYSPVSVVIGKKKAEDFVSLRNAFNLLPWDFDFHTVTACFGEGS